MISYNTLRKSCLFKTYLEESEVVAVEDEDALRQKKG